MAEVLPVGTRVRSFDFIGCRDCYIDGVIEGYGGSVFPSDAHYRVRTVSRVWEGREVPLKEPEQRVYPPINGMFGRILVERLK